MAFKRPLRWAARVGLQRHSDATPRYERGLGLHAPAGGCVASNAGRRAFERLPLYSRCGRDPLRSLAAGGRLAPSSPSRGGVPASARRGQVGGLARGRIERVRTLESQVAGTRHSDRGHGPCHRLGGAWPSGTARHLEHPSLRQDRCSGVGRLVGTPPWSRGARMTIASLNQRSGFVCCAFDFDALESGGRGRRSRARSHHIGARTQRGPDQPRAELAPAPCRFLTLSPAFGIAIRCHPKDCVPQSSTWWHLGTCRGRFCNARRSSIRRPGAARGSRSDSKGSRLPARKHAGGSGRERSPRDRKTRVGRTAHSSPLPKVGRSQPFRGTHRRTP